VLETTRGPIAAGAVVNAGGAWAGVLAALAGIDLPVTPLRRQVAVTEPFTGLPRTMPMTIFAGDGFHFRVRDGRVLLLWPDPPQAVTGPPRAGTPHDPFDTSVDPAWVEAVAAEARRRVPVLSSAAIDPAACRAGLYEMSPDRHAILGPAPRCANLFLANGSSGHGVMHAPALGRLLAEIMTTGAARSLDVTPLSPSRFTQGPVAESAELL
jgi:sarcosine oxidase subunit beta